MMRASVRCQVRGFKCVCVYLMTNSANCHMPVANGGRYARCVNSQMFLVKQ
jgi:hypothetical protein